jgi:hypothetical protein
MATVQDWLDKAQLLPIVREVWQTTPDYAGLKSEDGVDVFLTRSFGKIYHVGNYSTWEAEVQEAKKRGVTDAS